MKLEQRKIMTEHARKEIKRVIEELEQNWEEIPYGYFESTSISGKYDIADSGYYFINSFHLRVKNGRVNVSYQSCTYDYNGEYDVKDFNVDRIHRLNFEEFVTALEDLVAQHNSHVKKIDEEMKNGIATLKQIKIEKV